MSKTVTTLGEKAEGQVGSHWTAFYEICYLGFLKKYAQKIKI